MATASERDALRTRAAATAGEFTRAHVAVIDTHVEFRTRLAWMRDAVLDLVAKGGDRRALNDAVRAANRARHKWQDANDALDALWSETVDLIDAQVAAAAAPPPPSRSGENKGA